MAGKSTLYRPMRVTRLLLGEKVSFVASNWSINPTGVQSVNPTEPWTSPATKEKVLLARVVMKDRDEPDYYVVGDVGLITDAWEAALKGYDLTPGEWGWPGAVEIPVELPKKS
jgi:hypothetical protein